MDILLLIQKLSVVGAFFFTLCMLGHLGFVGSVLIYALRHPAKQ